MRDTIKKEPVSFVMFHADHQRLSDVAYFNYIKAASEFKGKASFFVVPAAVGADVSRTYSVPGYPTIMHFRSGAKTGLHYGMYSLASIKRFITNWTTIYPMSLNLPAGSSQSEIIGALADSYPDKSNIVLIYADLESKFGQQALILARELGPYFPFVSIADPSHGQALGLKNPSLVMLRLDDLQEFIYEGEVDADDMFIWTQHLSLPQFRPLQYERLFSLDGVALRSVIMVLDTYDYSQRDMVYPILGALTSKQGWIKGYYADRSEFSSLINLLNITVFPSMVLLSSNYSYLEYQITDPNNAEAFDSFFNETLELKTIKTPAGIYGDLLHVTEMSFEQINNEKPLITLFTSSFCVKCKTLKTSAIDAARTIKNYAGNVTFAIWDVTKSAPSFQKDKSIGIPSIYYVPKNNISNMVQFIGPNNYLSIIEWINSIMPGSFDYEKLMSNELGSGFDEI